MKNIYFLLIIASMLSACNKKADYDATGIFEATTVTVAAETAGKIISMSVNEGDSVVAGQHIALVDTATLALQNAQILSQQLSTLNMSPDISAQISALKTQIAHQEQEFNRVSLLLASGAATQKAYDDAKAQLNTLQSQLAAQLSTLKKNKSSISDNAEALQYQADQVKEMIVKSRVTAPITGTVLEKYAQAGEYAVPGKPLVKLANLDDVYLRSYFTVSQLAGIKLGQHVTVIADYGDSQYEYPGTVTWIAQESEFTPKSIQTRDSRANLVYAVKISVKNDGRLKLGQYGEVRLDTIQ